jgi:hypothetical protein
MTKHITITLDLDFLNEFFQTKAREEFLSHKVWGEYASQKEAEEYEELTSKLIMLEGALEQNILSQAGGLIKCKTFKTNINHLSPKKREKLRKCIEQDAEELEEAGTAEMASLDITCQRHGIELDDFYAL